MRRTPAHRLAALVVTIALVSGLAAMTVGAGASAASIDDLQKQAQALEGEINDNAAKLSDLNEQIKAVQDKLNDSNQRIADSQARIAAAQAETDRLSALVKATAASMYRSASVGSGNVLFSGDVSVLTTRQKYAATASAHDNLLMAQLSASKSDLQVVKKEAQDAKAVVEKQKAALDAAKADFDAAQAQRQGLLGQVNGQIASLVAQAAAARRATEAPKAFDPSKVPPASGRAGIVVSFAQQQLGKPYEYAGAGPSTYDCSGLTMAAWAAAGVGMGHNSEGQLASFPEVPMNALQPGDIVWFPGHVGIYVGGGAVIHAPHTGEVVSYISVSYFSRAVRPG